MHAQPRGAYRRPYYAGLGSCWILGSWMCRCRTTQLLSPHSPGIPYFSIVLKMGCASRTLLEYKTPESKRANRISKAPHSPALRLGFIDALEFALPPHHRVLQRLLSGGVI